MTSPPVQPCANGSGALDGGEERKENFKKALEVLLEPDGSPREFRPAEITPAPSSQPGSTPTPILSSDYGDNDAFAEEEEVASDTAEEEEAWTEDEAVGDSDAEEEDWTEEEEDWSEATTSTSAMSLWCGESKSNAYTNCNRQGYDCPDGVCFNGLKCFMVGDACEEGEGADSSSTMDKSPSPTPSTLSGATGTNSGVLGQFCAESFDDLESVCTTATKCEVPEDCPSGTYCWKEYMCGGTTSTTSPSVATAPQSSYSNSPSKSGTSLASTSSTDSPSSTGSAMTTGLSPQIDIAATYFCGKDRVQASTSCHKQCPNGLNEDCDEGETCFAYVTCGAGSSAAPTPGSELSLQPSPELPTEGVAMSSGPQSTGAVQQLFCASAKEELEASCLTAQSCISEPCPSKMFCFPFTCAGAVEDDNSTPAPMAPAGNQQSPAPVESQLDPVEDQLFCPQSSFVGWHTSADCKGESSQLFFIAVLWLLHSVPHSALIRVFFSSEEYFKCDSGAMGAIHICGDTLKFDKVRNQCHPEEQVNSFCYGPPQSSTSSGGLCSEGYTGWGSRNGCREYYWCDLGYAEVIYDCGQDLLFDITLELCNFANQVVCNENGAASAANHPPARPPAPLSFADTPVPRPSTLRPSPVMGAALTPLPGKPGSHDGVGINSSYGGAGGVVGDYNWSDSTASTSTGGPNTSYETPPWLLNTVMTTNGANGVMVAENPIHRLSIAFVAFQLLILFY